MSDAQSRLAFLKSIQSLTLKIHSTGNLDEIMVDLSNQLRALFGAERLTIYTMGSDKMSLVSKVKTGEDSLKEIMLPLNEGSIAGWVGVHTKLINIKDAYDSAELAGIHSKLKFNRETDEATGFKSKQMLCAPITTAVNNELLGVVQIINTKNGQPFAGYISDGLVTVCETLAVAFIQKRNVKKTVKTKYDYLIIDAILKEEEMVMVNTKCKSKGVSMEEVLMDDYNIKPALIGSSLSRFFEVPYEPFKKERAKPLDLLKTLKREFLEQNQWVPVEEINGNVIIISTDPERARSVGMARNVFMQYKLIYKVTTQREFNETLNQFFAKSADPSENSTSVMDLLSTMANDDEADTDVGADVSAASDNELVRLVNQIIVDAYKMGASDIHIEPRPGKGKILVRFRKDGTLLIYTEIPHTYRAAIAARIKIMCDLDIAERRKPQDGKIKFKKYGPLDIELRVATIPSAGGVEDVVMRILAAGDPIPMESLGVLPKNLERLKVAISKPYGLFFVCGPTGSGKTTTLHSILGHLNTPETKIWTAEDPVEITQNGLRQVQINKKAGLDFASIMKSFLRADPDIIMVGEMRDAETTSIGIEASLTGHLVFATLHTNSAPESITRLLDMGMDPFNFADALLGVLAQRLAKRLCKCKEAYNPAKEEIQALLKEYCEELLNTEEFKKDANAGYRRVYTEWATNYAENGVFTMYKPVGCDNCSNTGYRGRVGLHELMIGTDKQKQLIQGKARVAQMFAAALEDGMLTLKMDGMEKVLQGITDMKQIRAVCIK